SPSSSSPSSSSSSSPSSSESASQVRSTSRLALIRKRSTVVSDSRPSVDDQPSSRSRGRSNPTSRLSATGASSSMIRPRRFSHSMPLYFMCSPCSRSNSTPSSVAQRSVTPAPKLSSSALSYLPASLRSVP